MPQNERHFLSPWSVEETRRLLHRGDHNGQALSALGEGEKPEGAGGDA